MALRLSPFFFQRAAVKPAQGMGVQMIGLALLFLLGAFAGYWYAGYCTDQSLLLLEEYLDGYCQLFIGGTEQTVPLGSALRLYYGDLVLVFLLGFTPLGTLLIPVVSVVSGFTGMFAIGCFTQVYGRYGVALALTALGIRLLFTLPCLLWAGSYAWQAALSLLPGHRGKRCAPPASTRVYVYRFVVCAVILAIGICFERYLTPYLFHFALQGISARLPG